MFRDDLKQGYLVESQPYYTSPLHNLIGVDDVKGRFSLENIGKDGSNLTIVILSMNRSGLSIRLMESIKKCIPDFEGEFLIGDNGSAEEEKQQLKRAMKKMPFECRMIEFDRNYGVAGGRNKIFAYVKTDWLMSLDNDLFFTSNPLEQIQKDINTLGVKFLTMPLLNYGNENTGIYGGHLYVEDIEARPCVGVGSSFNCEGIKMNVPAPGFLCTGLPGGTCVINKETFFAVGGFEDNMFVGFEDTEFSVRLFQQGYKVGCCGMVSLYHDHPKPEKKVDRAYEGKRFSSEKLYESAMYFERKSGWGVWNEGVANWIKERQKATGMTMKSEDGRIKVGLLVDRPDWALDHIANELIANLSDEFEFIRIYEEDINNLADVLIVLEDCSIIHVMWRGILASYWSEWVQNRITSLGMTEPEFCKRYLENKVISTAVYDHLALTGEESYITSALFDDEKSIVNRYYVSSKKLEKLYSEDLELRLRPSACLPDGVNLELFHPDNLERFETIQKRTVRFGWVGNSKWVINDLKGINTIIRPAVQHLQAEGYDIELVTSDRNDQMIPHCKMPEFYKDIDCYICASLCEGTPNPVLEAMACGVPVISTDVGIVPECFGEMQKDFILKERSVEALEGKIRYLLKHPDLWKVLSEENMKSIKEWDWKRQVYGFKEYFNKCLKLKTKL